jgi:hypothetical protein
MIDIDVTSDDTLTLTEACRLLPKGHTRQRAGTPGPRILP